MTKVIEIIVPGFPAVVETVRVSAGAQGPKGNDGDVGPIGPSGEIGETGPAGPAGPAGSDGHSPVLTWAGDQIAIDGTVSGPNLTGPKGDPGEPGDPGGPPGPQGETGPAGSDGHSPVLTWSGDQIAIDGTVSGPHLTGATGPAGADGSPDTASQVLAKLVTVDGTASGLDADLLDGNHAAAFVLTGDSRLSDARTPTSHDHASNKLAQANTHESADTDSGTTALHHTLGTGANQACAGNDARLSDARTPTAHNHTGVYEPVLDGSGVLTKLAPVDGAGSGLDADLLDGNQATAFATSAHNHTGVYQPADSHLTTLSTDQYVEISAGAADGKFSGFIIAGTAGATLAFGDLIMKDAATSKWRLVDISTAAGSAGDARGLLGVCVLAASADAATKVLLHGMIRADAKFPTLTVGSAIYATTSGAITMTQPSTVDHIIRIVGFAHTADELWFSPSPDYLTHV